MVYLFLFSLFALIAPVRKEEMAITAILFALFIAFFRHYSKKGMIEKSNKTKLKWYQVIIELFILLILVCKFYTKWLLSSMLQSISNMLGVSNTIILAVPTIILIVTWLLSFPNFIGYLKKNIKNDLLKQWINSPCKKRMSAAILSSIIIIILIYGQRKLVLWSNTDNYWISCVLNGLYSTKDNYCNFLSPILASIVLFIDSIFTSADGWILLGEFLVVNGWWSVFYIFSLNMSKKKTLLITR